VVAVVLVVVGPVVGNRNDARKMLSCKLYEKKRSVVELYLNDEQ
jgi:hypothetical protein